MKTPAGRECKYFYGDYYRGREREECRLLPEGMWTPGLCQTCPVPRILDANACPYMRLSARVTRPLRAGFQRRVEVEAYCEKTHRRVDEPEIGCGECHRLPPPFEALE
jgi:hypothetical protein